VVDKVVKAASDLNTDNYLITDKYLIADYYLYSGKFAG